ncbi:MAG TPA: alanine racemase [Actinomycetota bacterium]
MAVIDLGAVRNNVQTLKPERAELMAVVKANAYGHGDVPVAQAALDAGATWLGVAEIEEGIRLREAGIDAPVLLLSEFPPGAEREGLGARLTPTLYTDAGLRGVVAAAAGPTRVHVKVDTGMHRVGVEPGRVEKFVAEALRNDLVLEGLWTHFAKADVPNDPVTHRQLEAFLGIARSLTDRGIRPRYLHAANTAGTLATRDAQLDMVRVGLGIYGLLPHPDLSAPAPLRPALSWRSAVSMTKRVSAGEGISYGHHYRLERESTIATVPVGYADGYSRLLSGKAEVIIGGRRLPVAGAVTMDQIMVDCGEHSVKPGDEVVLIGRQGDAEISADEVARWMGTINYEVVCSVSERVPREYVG